MNNLPQIIHLSTTDAEFRAALQIDPQAALAERGLETSAEELAALIELRSLITIQSQKLFTLLARVPLSGWTVMAPIPAPTI